MKDMIQVIRLLLKQRCFNPNGFEKTECEGKKINKILHLTVSGLAQLPNRKPKLKKKLNN